MDGIKKIIAVFVLSVVSNTALAQLVTVFADSLDQAEAKISAEATQRDARYKIVEAYTKKGVRMTAKLY